MDIKHEAAYLRFIRENIRQVEVDPHKPDDESGFCRCSRPAQWEGHTASGRPGTGHPQMFSPDSHLRDVPTTCYGNIRFTNYEYGIVATDKPYIRVSKNTSPADLLTLLTAHWRLRPPRLIISVTGGAQMFDVSTRHLPSFKRDLVKAATTADAWIITGGMETGVMGLVGEAICEHAYRAKSAKDNVVAIGIASWSALYNKDSLHGPAEKKLVSPPEATRRNKGVSAAAQTSLDPNHSHFILVDDGTEGQFGGEIVLRARLEEHISHHVMMDSDIRCTVPVAILVVEGGVGTIETAIQGVRNGSPVIVLDGSGRAADLIAFAWRCLQSKESKKHTGSKSTREAIREKVRDLLAPLPESEESVNSTINKVYELISQNNLLTVIPFGGEEMYRSIFEAFVKADRADDLTQLKLATIWNFSDFATNEMFGAEIRHHIRKGARCPDGDDGGLEPVHEAMFTALIHDRPHFVQMFLENGFSLTEFLTLGRLADLYKKVLADAKIGSLVWLLRGMISFKTMDRLAILQDVGKVIDHLLKVVKLGMYKGYGNPDSNGLMQKFTNPEKELFIWAVLLNRKDMAKLFWKTGIDPIGAAVVANFLLKRMADVANRMGETGLYQALIKHAGEYELMAVGTLEQCYLLDPESCHQLLTRELVTWGGQTTMSLATQAGCMEFMHQGSCQTKLDRIWMGHIEQFVSLTRLWICIICPLLSCYIIEFNMEDLEKELASTNKTNSVGPNSSDTGCDEIIMKKTKKPCYCCRTKRKPPLFFVILHMFITTPFVKFCYHTLSFLMHITLLCLCILTELDSQPFDPRRNQYEVAVWIYSFTIFVDEMNQAFSSCPRGLKAVMRSAGSYIADPWNLIDIFMLATLAVAVVLRFTVSEQRFMYVQSFYTLATMAAITRFLQIFFLSRKIGPIIVMVWEMILDVFFFLAILFNVMLTYGVAQQALHYPRADTGWNTFWRAFYRAYWFFGQETELEELNGDLSAMQAACEQNDSSVFHHAEDWRRRCDMLHYSWLAVLIDGIYILLVNVLLMNLLIAMFAYTFKKVEENSEKLWRYYRYGLIEEYVDKPAFAPPFNLITYLLRVVCKAGCCLFCGCPPGNNVQPANAFRQRFDEPGEYRALSAFERAGMEEYLLIEQAQQQQTDTATRQAVTELAHRLQTQMDEMATLSRKLVSSDKSMNKKLNSILCLLENKNTNNTPEVDYE